MRRRLWSAGCTAQLHCPCHNPLLLESAVLRPEGTTHGSFCRSPPNSADISAASTTASLVRITSYVEHGGDPSLHWMLADTTTCLTPERSAVLDHLHALHGGLHIRVQCGLWAKCKAYSTQAPSRSRYGVSQVISTWVSLQLRHMGVLSVTTSKGVRTGRRQALGFTAWRACSFLAIKSS